MSNLTSILPWIGFFAPLAIAGLYLLWQEVCAAGQETILERQI